MSMEINNSLDSLKSLLGVSPSASASTEPRSGGIVGGTGLGSDRATLSSAASEAAQSAGDDGVRMDKVASVQAALAAGNYSVPASAVASKLVDSMLGAL
jgi:negative regulator of flagellin synthesis FlgM